MGAVVAMKRKPAAGKKWIVVTPLDSDIVRRLDVLVRKGVFPTRSASIRVFLARGLKEEER